MAVSANQHHQLVGAKESARFTPSCMVQKECIWSDRGRMHPVYALSASQGFLAMGQMWKPKHCNVRQKVVSIVAASREIQGALWS